MSVFTWSPQYETGILAIDMQHKKLLESMNELNEAMRQGKGKEKVASTLDFLLTYTVLHFNTEEELMKKKGYPDFTNHKAVHDKLVAQVKEMKANFAAGKVLPMDVATFMSNWLKNHIMNTDKMYIPFLKN